MNVDFFFTNLEAKGIQDLSEDLRGDLEVAEGVSILEEALCIKSIFSNYFCELFNNLSAKFSLSIVS